LPTLLPRLEIDDLDIEEANLDELAKSSTVKAYSEVILSAQ
jgi:hypothetical protein